MSKANAINMSAISMSAGAPITVAGALARSRSSAAMADISQRSGSGKKILRVNIIEGADADLMRAISMRDELGVRESLACGANPMMSGGWPLHSAVEGCQMNMIDILLPLTDVAATKHKALKYAAKMGGNALVVARLAALADPEALSSALGISSAYGHADCVDALLAAGADAKSRSSFALGVALVNGRADLVRSLLPLSDPSVWSQSDMEWSNGARWGPLIEAASSSELSAECWALALDACSPPLDALREISALVFEKATISQRSEELALIQGYVARAEAREIAAVSAAGRLRDRPKARV